MENSVGKKITSGSCVEFIPRGLSRRVSAAYIGISPSLFDDLVRDGRMPRPIRINSRVVWDRYAIDEAFDALVLEQAAPINPWDE